MILPRVRLFTAVALVAAPRLSAQNVGGSHPFLHDVAIALGVAVIVAIVTAFIVYRWVRRAVMKSLDSGEAMQRVKGLIDVAIRIDENDIRRALTPETLAALLDAVAPQSRIVAVLGTDPARDQISDALKSGTAKEEIAAALAEPAAHSRLLNFLNTPEARKDILAIAGELDVRAAVEKAIDSHYLDRAILDVVFGEAGNARSDTWFETRGVKMMENLPVARAIARAARQGFYYEKDDLLALQGMLEPPISEDSIRDGLKRLR